MIKQTNYHKMLSIFAMLFLAILACQLPGSTNEPPTISVISPPQGTEIKVGETLEVVYHAEDVKGIIQVDMTLDGTVIASQKAPVPQGQSPLEGILRWTPETPGTYNLLLTAFNADEMDSPPAGVSISVVAGESQAEAEIEVEAKVESEAVIDPSPTVEPTAEPEPTPTVIPMDYATAHLPYYRLFDFDQGTRLSALETFPDFYLGSNQEGDYQLEADTGYEGIESKLVIWGNEEPGYDDCSSASLSTDPIVLDHNTPNGTYVCMQTGEGQYGYMRLDGLLLDPELGDRALDVAYVIWNQNGVDRITPPSLHTYALTNVDDGAGHDLDFRTNTQSADLSFTIVGEEVEITPLGSASLALWGTSFPSKADCEGHTLASDAIRVAKEESLEEDIYFCYQTDQGRMGRLQYFSVEEDAEDLSFFFNTDIPQIHFGYDTWK